MEGSTADVDKHMSESGPRRVEKLCVQLKLPEHLSGQQRAVLQRVAEHCPVKRSLDPLIQLELIWN